MTFVEVTLYFLQCLDLLGQNEAHKSPAAFTQSKIQVFDWMLLIHRQMLL